MLEQVSLDELGNLPHGVVFVGFFCFTYALKFVFGHVCFGTPEHVLGEHRNMFLIFFFEYAFSELIRCAYRCICC